MTPGRADLPHLVPAPPKTGRWEKSHDGLGTQLERRPGGGSLTDRCALAMAHVGGRG